MRVPVAQKERHTTRRQQLRELMEYGVVQAVNELCLAENWELAFFALSPEMYCDVALRRRVDPISAKGRPRWWRRLIRR